MTGYWKTDQNVTLGMVHSILLAQLIATLIYYPCTIALTVGLCDNGKSYILIKFDKVLNYLNKQYYLNNAQSLPQQLKLASVSENKPSVAIGWYLFRHIATSKLASSY